MTQVLYILFADVISLVFLARATGLFWPILGWIVFFLGVFLLDFSTKIDCNHSLVV